MQDGSLYCNWCGARQVSQDDGEVKVPEPRRLPSGKWFIQLRLQGRSISITEESRAKCVAKARAIKSGIMDAGDPSKASTRTLGQIIDYFLESHEGVLSPSTMRGYKGIRKRFLQPEMKKSYNAINWQAGCNREARRYSTKSMRNYWGFVSTALAYSKLPVPQVDLPKVQSKPGEYLTHDQILVFLKEIEGTEFELAALLGLHSLRRSEIAAVTWGDLDVEKETITVSGAAVYDENNDVIQKKTNKNASSQRVIPFLIPRLKEVILSAGPRADLSVPVLYYRPNWIGESVNRACRNAGLPLIGAHGLRRSFASLAYHLGLDERTIMRLGGWSDWTTMHKLYIRISQDVDQTAKTAFQSFFTSASSLKILPKDPESVNAPDEGDQKNASEAV